MAERRSVRNFTDGPLEMDELGWLLSETNPLSQVTTRSYDLNGNVVCHTVRKNPDLLKTYRVAGYPTVMVFPATDVTHPRTVAPPERYSTT